MKRVSKDSAIRIVLFVAVIVAAALLLGVIKLPLTQSRANEGPVTGPATSWSTQLSTAMEEAQKNIKSPVLVAIQSQPIGGPSNSLVEDQAFELTFLFFADTPERTRLFLNLNDSDPKQFVSKSGGFIPIGDTKQNLSEYTTPLETVKLSPRDVYSLTRSDAITTLGDTGAGYLVNMYLHLFPEFDNMPDNQAVWSIYYYRAGSGGQPEKRIDYLINAADGTILQRVEDMNFPAAKTPTIVP